jgi:predicted nucleotidyltransferase
MTYQREAILKSLQKDRAFLRRVGVRRIGLFGSAVRGEAREDSDLDFVVELERVSFDAYMDLKFHLEDRFKKNVDLVLSHSIKPALRQRILGETVYASGF